VTTLTTTPLAPKETFLSDLRGALDHGRGLAAGKLGFTERALVQYPLLLEREATGSRLRAFELALAHRALRHGGVFPPEPGFLARFARLYSGAVAALDCLGVVARVWPQDEPLLGALGFRGVAVDYLDQEPDRSSPADERRCWLPFVGGRRVLLVSPFAELLRERATRETFEAVWAKTGKPWFEPAAVDAVELPYGFAHTTWERYPTALDLLAEIEAKVAARTFDVALVGAGVLGSMLAVAVKRQGRVGISLGGHLQVLFGVLGQRWRERPDWQRRYVNDAWIDMPERYRADARETGEDYW
jgi:hypothetical protein